MNNFTPTEFISVVNQTLEYAYSTVMVTGEVASYKVNQGKWVFFDLKDEESSVSCFMPVWNLRVPLEDGMKVTIQGAPKLTKWGRFSITVSAVKPVGEGSLKKAFELLKKKLAGEGLFDPARKRALPEDLTKIGVISSTQAAGYADFIKIINARWGGIKITTAHTQVQGIDAPDQIIRALKYFNERSDVQAIVIIRGGGSADDLSCFNDELLVREIAGSKIPVVTGIGHEVDETLADLVADVRASTPSNVAEILTRDRSEMTEGLRRNMSRLSQTVLSKIDVAREDNFRKIKRISEGLNSKYIEPILVANQKKISDITQRIKQKYDTVLGELQHKMKVLELLNPEKVLSQGYAILGGKISPGNVVKITTIKENIEAEIIKVEKRR